MKNGIRKHFLQGNEASIVIKNTNVYIGSLEKKKTRKI